MEKNERGTSGPCKGEGIDQRTEDEKKGVPCSFIREVAVHFTLEI